MVKKKMVTLNQFEEILITPVNDNDKVAKNSTLVVNLNWLGDIKENDVNFIMRYKGHKASLPEGFHKFNDGSLAVRISYEN